MAGTSEVGQKIVTNNSKEDKERGKDLGRDKKDGRNMCVEGCRKKRILEKMMEKEKNLESQTKAESCSSGEWKH